ncbi:MAG: hypothetical protein GX802_03685 [Clostridiales bacterium]|nr:hypothetical protein [Clostridiales bacterium]
MRYYISAAHANHGVVRALSFALSTMGHVNAYDMLTYGDIRNESESKMTESSFNLVQSIRDAELFIHVCPQTHTTATDLGIALASRAGKRIIIWSTTGREFECGSVVSAYYFHPSVIRFTGNFEEFIKHIESI